MFPRLHALQDAVALLWRQAIEALQALLKLLLLLRRQFPELRIVAQRAFLLVGRQVLVVAKPVTSVGARFSRRGWGFCRILGCRLLSCVSLLTRFLPLFSAFSAALRERATRSLRASQNLRGQQNRACYGCNQHLPRHGAQSPHVVPLPSNSASSSSPAEHSAGCQYRPTRQNPRIDRCRCPAFANPRPRFRVPRLRSTGPPLAHRRRGLPSHSHARRTARCQLPLRAEEPPPWPSQDAATTQTNRVLARSPSLSVPAIEPGAAYQNTPMVPAPPTHPSAPWSGATLRIAPHKARTPASVLGSDLTPASIQRPSPASLSVVPRIS